MSRFDSGETEAVLHPAVRILVVDDFERFRQFIVELLGKRPELQVVGEASDGLEALQKAAELRPDLILLDIGLPSLNGIEVARQMRSLVPESKIIFLTQKTSADVVQEALGQGAWGYVTKPKAQADLVAAVEAVLSGKTLSVTYQQRPISTSHLRRTSATEWDIASTRLQRGEFILASAFRDPCQFRLLKGEVREAAIQADQKFREYPDAGCVQILATGEMYDHLSRAFCLIA